jgi:hypothetical protein
MANAAFDPVSAWETLHRRRALHAVETAARWLMQRWPRHVEKPKSYRRAVEICLAAIHGRATPAEVRAALIAALDEAGLLDSA